jgi:hypothetical protein
VANRGILPAGALLLFASCTFDGSNEAGPGDVGENVDEPAGPDAAMIDEPDQPDAEDGEQTFQVIESLEVPVDGSSVISTSQLAEDVLYRLRASGTYVINDFFDVEGDAEYFGFNTLLPIADKQLTVDTGVAIDDDSVDLQKSPHWGSYRADHIYEIDFLGKGDSISVNLHDGNYSNNSGALTLEILASQ